MTEQWRAPVFHEESAVGQRMGRVSCPAGPDRVVVRDGESDAGCATTGIYSDTRARPGIAWSERMRVRTPCIRASVHVYVKGGHARWSPSGSAFANASS